MTARALANNLPLLPSAFDTGLANYAQPSPTQFANGFIDNVDDITAEAYNYLHNATSSMAWLAQLLGIALPFNPVAGAAIIACPKGGIVSLINNATGATEFYVALNTRAIGYTDPSLDPTNWAFINLAALAQYVHTYADAGGTADAITAIYTVTYPVLTDGFRLTVGIATPNATTTPTFAPTLNANAQTARTIVKMVGNAEVALAAGDLQGDADLSYDLTNTLWILMNPASANATVLNATATLTAAEAFANGIAIGVGQTWTNETGTRALNATYGGGNVYTNSTGRPIQINVTIGSASNQSIYLYVNAVIADQHATNPNSTTGMVSAIVPAGATYQVVAAGTLNNWAELR